MLLGQGAMRRIVRLSPLMLMKRYQASFRMVREMEGPTLTPWIWAISGPLIFGWYFFSPDGSTNTLPRRDDIHETKRAHNLFLWVRASKQRSKTF